MKLPRLLGNTHIAACQKNFKRGSEKGSISGVKPFFINSTSFLCKQESLFEHQVRMCQKTLFLFWTRIKQMTLVLKPIQTILPYAP
ncbi:MAG TPA: hypothetical protein DEB70_04300 [Planctomycetaceae bacterium]|nr:hypothetical protein [Planctomycetaceae bacterium]